MKNYFFLQTFLSFLSFPLIQFIFIPASIMWLCLIVPCLISFSNFLSQLSPSLFPPFFHLTFLPLSVVLVDRADQEERGMQPPREGPGPWPPAAPGVPLWLSNVWLETLLGGTRSKPEPPIWWTNAPYVNMPIMFSSGKWGSLIRPCVCSSLFYEKYSRKTLFFSIHILFSSSFSFSNCKTTTQVRPVKDHNGKQYIPVQRDNPDWT